MVVHTRVEFDNNPQGIFYAGQMVTGRITLTVDKAKQVKGVSLKIKGFAHTRWSESTTRSSGKERRTSTTYYTGHEDYVSSITYLIGSSENQTVVIEPGIHTYSFSCHLPVACPSSFEGDHGHVRYLVKVVLHRPWKFDQSYTRAFTVLKLMDLNYDSPLLRMPAHTEAYKTFCCGPCKSDPLKIQVNIPQSGYVPGQCIPVSVLVINDSNVPVESIKLKLSMLVCYYSQSPSSKSKSSKTTVAKQLAEGVLRQCKKHFQYSFPIPATPPTCFNLCRIIQIAYQLEVEAQIRGHHANQTVCIPVTIGSVPLMNVIQQQPTSSYGMQRALMNNIDTVEASSEFDRQERVAYKTSDDPDAIMVDTGTAPIPDGLQYNSTRNNNAPERPSTLWSDPSIPPPSYEEAIHVPHANITADEKHDYGDSDFAPRYPVFNIPSPSAPTEAEVSDNVGNKRISNSNGTWL